MSNFANFEESDFSTKAIRVGQDPKQWSSYAVIPPIILATTFQQLEPGVMMQFEYSRCGNPTRNCLELALAALEDAKYGLTFSSGMAAIATITYLLKSGDHIVCGNDVYGGTNRHFNNFCPDMGIEVTFVDTTEIDNVRNALRNNTKMIWIESPTNPTMKLCDIQAVADLVKSRPNVIVVVDNTFLTPYFQKPLNLGAHIVVHSVTKYLNGHSDVTMGALVTNRASLFERLQYLQYSLGSVPSPFDCFLVNRGLKTLHVRMEQHMKNGLAIAQFLEAHPLVNKVYHPGLKSHPQYELGLRQSTGHCGMVSFFMHGGPEEAKIFVKSLKVFIFATSLGGIESLVEIPSLMSHSAVPEDQRAALEIHDGFVRLSAGIESTEDLIEDLKQALEEARLYSWREKTEDDL